MKVIRAHQLLTPKHAVFGASLTLLAATLIFPTAQAKTVNVNSGPIINGLFARIVCPNVAAQANGVWTGEYDRKRQTCEVNIPDPVKQNKPVKRAPLKPPVKLLNVEAGRIWSQPHANQRCKQLAKANKGRWTGNWSEKTETKPSYCQIEVLLPKKPKPTHKTVNIEAGRIWSQAHANQRCVALAKINKGQWTGKFSTVNHKSSCEIKVALTPPKPKPTHKMVNIDAGRIWSKSHANHRCAALAKNNKGQWTGKYTTTNNRSSCQIKVAMNHAMPKPAVKKPKPKPVKRKVREISAGVLQYQWQANRKCKRIAKEANGSWTGEWRKSTNQQQGACEIKLAGNAKKKQQQQPQPASVPTTVVKDADAGPIWDQAHANRKCPLIAKNNKGQWTGNWRKVGSNNMSVCQIRVDAGATAAKPVVKTETTYVPLPKPKPAAPANNVREIFAGPIWDQAQANKKCQLLAANNKGVWTGKWRKTDARHNSLCSIRF
ncbi:MAG: mannan-binding protein [Leucothrix sp.]